jgi:subtilisin-like proprotein convertase family protein
MKRLCFALVLAIAAGAALNTRADINTFNYTTGFANGGVIPDGNTTGWFDTRTVSGITDPLIADVNVFLNISNGYSGDFYAYLTHSSGFSVLLNRPGRTSSNPFGYGDSGLNVTFDDNGSNGDIHLYQAQLGYASLIGNGSTWLPDGRNTNPLSALDTDARNSLLNQFNGLDPNGGWTLFIADLSGGGQGAVVNWGLTITTVPEPSVACLFTLGALGMLRKKLRAA